MNWHVRLLSASVHYAEGVQLHTALSGPVSALDELYLLIEDGDTLVALGEIRENVEYLSGLPAHRVRGYLVEALSQIDWTDLCDGNRKTILAAIAPLPALPRALLDCTLLDLDARARGLPLAKHVSGEFAGAVETNQCLQLTTPKPLVETAQDYVVRGFRQLKLRVGGGSFDHDVTRLHELREHFGANIALAIDANGKWTMDQAVQYLPQLAPFDLAYIEQPVPTGDWTRLARVIDTSPAPIMLDESAASLEAVRDIVSSRLGVWLHLKIPKLGGITPLLEAAALLNDNAIPFMVGQMNEGGAATAAAVHCVQATRPRFAELYGADGLVDDPVRGVLYGQGTVEVANTPGLGVTLEPEKCICLWETTL